MATAQPLFDFASTPDFLNMHILEQRGCPLHYWTGGPQDQPPLVFLHGALMDHRMFNAQLAVVAQDYRVLVWDARGHGQSHPVGIEEMRMDDFTADLAAVLDQEGIGSACLIGQSMGAYVAQHFMRTFPERATGLVVIGSTPIMLPVSWLEMSALRFSTTAFGVWPYENLKKYMADATAHTGAVKQYAKSAMDLVDRPTFIQIWKAVNTAIRREGYPDFMIQVPFLLTHGEFDRSGTIRRDAPRWAQLDPNLEYKVIPDASHNANQDNPTVFNEILLDFLNRRLPTNSTRG